jgi:hypothetical protein
MASWIYFTAFVVLTLGNQVSTGKKNILTGEEVKERIKKLKSETPLQFRWLQ